MPGIGSIGWVASEGGEKIFVPFYTTRKNGSGIGLNLSKTFIDLHKGFVEVKSGVGTEFVIVLQLGTDHFNKKQIQVIHKWLQTCIGDIRVEMCISIRHILEN